MEEEIRVEQCIRNIKEFSLLVNDKQFNNITEATAYVKNVIPYLDSLSITEDKIKKVFKTLVNAYNNKVPLYIQNNFTKEKYGCKFSIMLKGE